MSDGSWTPPDPDAAPPAPTDGPPAGWGGQQPQYVAPPPGQWGPQQPPQYGQPPSGQPQWGQPQYAPQYGQQWGGPAGYGAWGGPNVGLGRPGIIPLRPLGVGELIDGSLTAIRHHPAATLGLSAVVMTVIGLVNLLPLVALTASADTTAATGDIDALAATAVVGNLIAVVLDLLAGSVLAGALTAVVGDAVLGRPTSLGQAWRTIRPRIGALIGAAFLTTLALVGAVIGVLLPILFIAAIGGGIGLLLLGVPVAACALVFVYVAFALATPALILEKQRVFPALRRSWALVRGGFWRVAGVLVLAQIIGLFVSGMLQIPFQIGASGGSFLTADSLSDPSLLSLFLITVGGILANTIVTPFTAGVAVLVYVNQRMRREGLDVALAAAAAAPQQQ